MPTEVFSPPPGKFGALVLDSNKQLLFEEWSLSLQIEKERLKHFYRSANSQGLTFSEIMTGFTGGTANCRGKFNLTEGALLPTDKGAYIDNEGIGFLGYTQEVGFAIAYKLTDLTGGQNTGNAGGGTYEFVLEILDCLFVVDGDMTGLLADEAEE